MHVRGVGMCGGNMWVHVRGVVCMYVSVHVTQVGILWFIPPFLLPTPTVFCSQAHRLCSPAQTPCNAHLRTSPEAGTLHDYLRMALLMEDSYGL